MSRTRAGSPNAVNEPRQEDIPVDQDAAGMRHESVHDEAHPHARWSALSEGRFQKLFFDDNGWACFASEDFGLALLHAFGPDGYCFK